MVVTTNRCNFFYVMFLLKSNVPKLVSRHVASFDWKITPMEVAAAEISWVRLAHEECWLPHSIPIHCKVDET